MIYFPKLPRYEHRISHESLDPFREVKELFYNEVDGLTRMLLDVSLNDSIRHAIRKYLTVTIFEYPVGISSTSKPFFLIFSISSFIIYFVIELPVV
jgi:hypothetical protein